MPKQSLGDRILFSVLDFLGLLDVPQKVSSQIIYELVLFLIIVGLAVGNSENNSNAITFLILSLLYIIFKLRGAAALYNESLKDPLSTILADEESRQRLKDIISHKDEIG